MTVYTVSFEFVALLLPRWWRNRQRLSFVGGDGSLALLKRRGAADAHFDEVTASHGGLRIARIRPEQFAAAAELHEQLAVQFVARGGHFLRYYLACRAPAPAWHSP